MSGRGTPPKLTLGLLMRARDLFEDARTIAHERGDPHYAAQCMKDMKTLEVAIAQATPAKSRKRRTRSEQSA